MYISTYLYPFFTPFFGFSRTQARILVRNNLEFILLRDARVLQVGVSVCHRNVSALFTCM